MTKKGKAKTRDRKKAEQAMFGGRSIAEMLGDYFGADLLKAEMGKRDYLLSKLPKGDFGGGYLEIPMGLGKAETEEEKMAKQQAYAEKMAQAKQIQDEVNEQIAAQVKMWREEVEGGNHLIGMMLAETHPKIVTYDFLFKLEFGPAPILPVFHWPEEKNPDPELEKDAAKKSAEKRGMSEDEIMSLLAMAKAGQAADGKEEAGEKMKAALAEAAREASGKGGMTPAQRDALARKLGELEKQKAEWERMEREIAQGFRGGSAGGAAKSSDAKGGSGSYGIGYLQGQDSFEKFRNRGSHALGGSGSGARRSTPGEEKAYAAGQMTILQFRGGTVALDVLCKPKKDFTPKNFDGIQASEHMIKGIEMGELKLGEYQEGGGYSEWKEFPKEIATNVLEKFMKVNGGKQFQLVNARHDQAKDVLFVQLSG